MKRAKLHPITRPTAKSRHNSYCGPAALSCIAGIDTAEAAARLRRVSGLAHIKGTGFGDMRRALRELGYNASSVFSAGSLPAASRPTLAQWSRRPGRDAGSLYLIEVGHHWAVVQGRRYACGIEFGLRPSTGGVRALRGAYGWRKRVRDVYKVEAVAGLTATPAPPRVPRVAAPAGMIDEGDRVSLMAPAGRVWRAYGEHELACCYSRHTPGSRANAVAELERLRQAGHMPCPDHVHEDCEYCEDRQAGR